MSKGIAYFKDGHTEEIIWCHEKKDERCVYFDTPTGRYTYNAEVYSTDSGYLFTRDIFRRFEESINDYLIVPIERIVLL